MTSYPSWNTIKRQVGKTEPITESKWTNPSVEEELLSNLASEPTATKDGFNSSNATPYDPDYPSFDKVKKQLGKKTTKKKKADRIIDVGKRLKVGKE